MKMMKIANKITTLFSVALFAFGLITTPVQAATATVITIGYTNATTSGFTVNGYVGTNGGVLNSAYFQYSAVNSQTLTLSTTPITVSPTGYFQHTFTGMTAGTYVFRAVAIVDGVITNGATKSAVVAQGASTTIPVLTTINGSLSGTTITMNGYFNSSSTPTQTFFQYNTTNNFASPQSTTTQSQTALSGYFSGTITNATAGTTYYFRAVGTNASGIGYGTVKSVIVPATPPQLCTDPSATNYGGSLPCQYASTLPSVTTTTTTNITQTTAIANGTVTGANITARGFQYYTGFWSSSPTSVTASGTTSFSATLSGLSANTTYYVRAFATNSAGTAYGSYVAFTTSGNTQATCTDPSATNYGGALPCTYAPQLCTDPSATNYGGSLPCQYASTLPSVTTTTTTNITQTTAIANGTVTGANITARGFQYYTGFWSSSPTSVTASGTTSFSATLSGLSANTTYYVRAFATNSAGTAYGSYVAFTTSGNTQATCTDPSATNYGGALPCTYAPQLCTDPSATNYGGSLPCQYPQPLSAQTLSATNVMDTAAQIRGSYTGGVAASMRFKYGTNPSPTIGVTAYGNSISYTTYLTNLMPNTTYFYQACVTNNANVEFCGQTLSFITTGNIIPQGQAPVAITQNAQVNGTTATLSGFVDMQNTSGTYRFEYGTSPSFGMSTQTMQSTSATTVSATTQNLIANTMYYYRIVAQNNYGVTNGNTLTFTTIGGPVCGTNQTLGGTSNGLIWNAFGSGTINQTTQIPCNPNPVPPPCGTNGCLPPPPQPTQGSVITTIATNIAQSTAQLNAIARNVQGTVAFEYGFSASQLGYTTQPQTINNAGGISFYDTVYNLEPNTTYYFRAFTQTNGTIIRGDIISFRTKSIKDPKVVVVNNGTGTGTATTAVMVKIENTYKNACVNDVVDYTITYKNTTTKTLKDVALVVTLPGELEFARATKGSYSKRDNTLTITIDSLASKESGVMNVQVRAIEVRQGMVTTATMSYTLPTGTQEQAIAYDIIDEGTCADNGNGLGAAALFGFDFFPNTLVGWLILTLVILAIILFSRKYFVKE